ncbi:hypothetical protein [Pantoea agglomerans]|jgi:hypothetical protein|uniref:hypothetical protein n=1 Tax=Enterobacter agglomerans TaxID=549 RepID=UPI003C7CD7E1
MALLQTRLTIKFSQHVTDIDASIAEANKTVEQKSVAEAWKEYRETHVIDDQDGTFVVRNAVRPSQFFNLDDLHFTQDARLLAHRSGTPFNCRPVSSLPRRDFCT